MHPGTSVNIQLNASRYWVSTADYEFALVSKVTFPTCVDYKGMCTRSLAIAEVPRDALSRLKCCQLLHNSTKNLIRKHLHYR